MESQSTSEPDAGWSQCPPGTLQQYRRSFNRRQQLQRMVPALGLLLVATLGVAFYATRDVPQPAIVDAAALESSIHGGISCADVRRHAPAYVAGTLAPELSAQIDQHLRECPPCVRYFQRHFPEHRLPVARNRDRVFELLGVVR